jgi:hypothetical protein
VSALGPASIDAAAAVRPAVAADLGHQAATQRRRPSLHAGVVGATRARHGVADNALLYCVGGLRSLCLRIYPGDERLERQ